MNIGRYKRQAYDRLYRYSMTNDEYEGKLFNQDFQCPICNKQLYNGNTSVDHDHDTGDNRGILCGQCNAGIGNLRDDPNLLTNAKAYLNLYN